MPAPELAPGLSSLAPSYDGLICDVWGVVHNGREAFPQACDALVRYRQGGGVVVLVSNAPRPSHGFIVQMRDLGVPDAAWDQVITSGDATRRLLVERTPGPAWALGPARDAPLYEDLDLDLTETEEGAAFISCTGLFDDEIETPDDYRARFEIAAARKLVMICANPDKVVQRGEQLIWCAGALAELYASMGGEVIMAGKPHPPIYDLARASLAEARGGALDGARILAIGDGVPTDIVGANQQGLDCLFVAGGIHAKEVQGQGGELDAAALSAFLAGKGVEARYAMAGLRW